MTVCTQINGKVGHDWWDAVMRSSGRSFPNSHCFHLLASVFFLPICRCSWCCGVRASEAFGIRALNGINVGNNQMDQSSDSRDLFLPAVYQIYLTPLCPLPSFSPVLLTPSGQNSAPLFVLFPASLKTDGGGYWMWYIDSPRRREKCCRSLFWEPRHQRGFDNITFQKVQK